MRLFYTLVQKITKWINEKKRVKHMNKRDKESYDFNKTDILLYDRDKVTLEDCIIMQEKYGLSAIIDSGTILGFTSK